MTNASDLERVRFEKLTRLMTTGRKTGKLHAVMLWFAISDNKVFLSHEGEETDWMKNIRKNRSISFEIGGIRFYGMAQFLDSTTIEATVAKKSLYEKYYGKAAKETIDDWFSMSRLLLVTLQNGTKDQT